MIGVSGSTAGLTEVKWSDRVSRFGFCAMMCRMRSKAREAVGRVRRDSERRFWKMGANHLNGTCCRVRVSTWGS